MVEELERSASEKMMPGGGRQGYQATDPDPTRPSLDAGVEYPQVSELDPGTWDLMQQIL